MKNTVCEKLMWLVTKGPVLDFVKENFSEEDFSAFRKKFPSEYRKIRDTVDDIGPLTKNPLRICLAGGVIWMAAYEALEGKMSEEMFSEMITRCMTSPLFKKAFGAKNPFVAEKQQKKLALHKSANEISKSEYNWKTDYRPGRDETEYFCTYRRCGLCTLGRNLGHPELIQYMCKMDYISIDIMGGILYRTQTLATGGSCCDFHVVKKGSKWEEK